MAFHQSPKIVTDGLKFYHDMYNTKSWAGAPTTNYFWSQNARTTDLTYTPYVAVTTGTWQAKHPDAIQVYNTAGSDITGYINTGVTDWTNTYHAVWIFDHELGKPVVAMRDIGNGAWMAKNWGTGYSYSAMGLGAGSTYTISWLQWTDNLSKSANAGIYNPNLSGSWNFHDGQSNSYGTSYNTKLKTWQRVYATFTVSSGLNLTASNSCYMYGHYGPRGTLKVADVQLEAGSIPTGFSSTLTRSSTQCITDMAGTITGMSPVNMSYNSSNEYVFNGTSSYIDMGGDRVFKQHGGWTVETWAKFDSLNSASLYNFIGASTITHNSWYWTVFNNKLAIWNRSPGAWYYGSTTLSPGQWYHCVLTCSGDGTNYKMYLNGVEETGTAASYSFNPAYSGLIVGYIGRGDVSNARYTNGRFASTKIYEKPLSSTEVLQNFRAHKSRFGL